MSSAASAPAAAMPNKLGLTLDEDTAGVPPTGQNRTPCETPKGYRAIPLDITPTTWKADLSKCNVCGEHVENVLYVIAAAAMRASSVETKNEGRTSRSFCGYFSFQLSTTHRVLVHVRQRARAHTISNPAGLKFVPLTPTCCSSLLLSAARKLRSPSSLD